ncbi:hypothetical protein J6590_062408 [Homalodisca vitripennis]|nr:hypothetical protein J6590_062408 [Homalodisca vitripennis]
MAGQAGYLQGQDRSTVTHPSSSHARRHCLIRLSCDNRCTRYSTPLAKKVSTNECSHDYIAVFTSLSVSKRWQPSSLRLPCAGTSGSQTVPCPGCRVGDRTAPNEIVEPMFECRQRYGTEHCHGATQFQKHLSDPKKAVHMIFCADIVLNFCFFGDCVLRHSTDYCLHSGVTPSSLETSVLLDFFRQLPLQRSSVTREGRPLRSSSCLFVQPPLNILTHFLIIPSFITSFPRESIASEQGRLVRMCGTPIAALRRQLKETVLTEHASYFKICLPGINRTAWKYYKTV